MRNKSMNLTVLYDEYHTTDFVTARCNEYIYKY